jgi:N12 class adenine-specific DNA methylase
MEQAFVPGQVDPVIPRGPRDYFVYTANLGSMAAAAISTQNVAISADALFFLTGLTYFSDLAGAAQTDSTRVLPLITIQITDTGSGRQLFSAVTPIPNLMGDGTHVYRLIHPRYFRPSTTIQITATNYSAATTYTNTFIALIGFKIYTKDVYGPIG